VKKAVVIPWWIIIPILIALMSKGQIYFAAILTTTIAVKPAYRLGRKYVHLTEFEHAKIAASAPIALILISLFLNLINTPITNDFALVTGMMAIFSLLPLPGLIGTILLFSSKPLYIFTAIFILAISLLLKLPNISPFVILIFAIILAALSTLLYFWRRYK